MQNDAPQTLSPREYAAWRGFLRTHAVIVRALDRELEVQEGLSLGVYDVLVALVQAEGRRLRMTDLADAILLSPSGLTRVIDRLVREGYVKRTRCEDDRRGQWAELTAYGEQTLLRARPSHREGIRLHFLSHLSDEQLDQLVEIWESVVGDPVV